jgi:hypothetical protein
MAKITDALIALAMICTLVPDSWGSDLPQQLNKQQEAIVEFHSEAKARSRQEAIQEKQYRECTKELALLISKIQEEAKAKGQTGTQIRFGYGPGEVDLYLGWKATELQKKCEAMKVKPAETERLLPKVESMIAE